LTQLVRYGCRIEAAVIGLNQTIDRRYHPSQQRHQRHESANCPENNPSSGGMIFNHDRHDQQRDESPKRRKDDKEIGQIIESHFAPGRQ
jgi:hypothetical protein